MNLFKASLALATIMLLTACGEPVIIPPGEVGKELGTNGFEDGIRAPGGFKLSTCYPFTPCPILVRLQTHEDAQTIEGNYFLPKSNLDLNLKAAVRYRVREDNASRNKAFGTVPYTTSKDSSRVVIITAEKMFGVLIAPRVNDTIREALGEYQIDQIMENLGVVRDFVEHRLKESVANTPVEILSVNFSSIDWPETVMQSKRTIAQVESERLAKTKRVQAELEIKAKERELDIMQAKIDNEVDAITSEFMGPKMATWRMLEILDKAAEKGVPITIHPSMFPQGAFDMEKDTENYAAVPTAPTAPLVNGSAE